jgi:O-antigen ligase
MAGALWPFVLLAPFVPGLPRPELSGLVWRQELLLALLLSSTSALLLKRSLLGSTTALPQWSAFQLSRRELLLISTLMLFVLWSIASLAWAANPYHVLHYSFTWGGYLLFFLLMRAVAAKARLLALSLASFVAVTLIISLASVIGALSAPISLFRYNGLGEPLAISVPLIAALALFVRRRRAAFICGATFLLAWLAMLQAFERTPFLSTSAGLILMASLILLFPQFRRRLQFKRALLLLACFVLLTAFQFMPAMLSFGVAEPPHTTLSRLQTTTVADENTQARLLLWGVALEMWREHPLTGVGASHYGINFAQARAGFAASHPDSKLLGLNEGHLAMVAHNEYLQMLAELGTVGLLLFLLFAACLVVSAWLALKRSKSPVVPGAVSALAVFAINSGASSISFRWMASGLLFFFAAAIVTRFAHSRTERREERAQRFSQPLTQRAATFALSFSLLMLCGMSLQALNVTEHGRAQSSADAESIDKHYAAALFWNPLDGATHFNYGLWLFHQKRYTEAVPHLRFGLGNGINTSVCYAHLAAAQAKAGEGAAGAATLAEGLKVYPHSIFLRVSHATALSKLGRETDAQSELARALSMNEAMARGWWELINSGKDGATEAARLEPAHVTAPGELFPSDAVFLVLSENGERAPAPPFTEDGKRASNETR